MLNVHICLVRGGTVLIASVGNQMVGADNLFFLEPPLIWLYVVFEFFPGGEEHLVFVDQLLRHPIAHDFQLPEIHSGELIG